MIFIFYLICFVFIAITVRWIYGIFYAYVWIKRESAKTINIAMQAEPIFILIPVLSEVGRIESTVAYFVKTFAHNVNLRLVLITSESEYLYCKTKPNTIDICQNLQRQFPEYVIHCHYPNINGRMSHQLNYAIRQLEGKLKSNSLLAIYNADSKPHPSTFEWVIEHCQRDRTLKIFQQYGDYTKNISKRANSILLSAALWQNRWAIGFELFKVLRSRKVFRSIGFRRPLNYVIGHGLFLTKELYDKSIGFSEVFHNEDAILGLELSFLKEKITPLPFFDISDTPNTVFSLYRQKIHWFFGPYQSLKYFTYLKQKYRKTSRNEKNVLFLQALKLLVALH